MSSKKKARLNSSNNPLNPTDSVLASFEQVSQSTSQIANKSNDFDLQSSQPPAVQETKTSSLPPNQSTSQPATSPSASLRKATFKIDSQVLDSLDRYHLQLQMDLSKRNAPFKETIVELALKNILQQSQDNPEQLLQQIQQLQQTRS